MARGESGGGSRAAFLAAVFGALIGGVASYGGAYLTSTSQAQQQIAEERQIAYASLLAEAEKYKLVLLGPRDVVSAGDENLYDEARNELIDQAGVLYAASVRAYLVGGSQVSAAATDVATQFFGAEAPLDIRAVDVPSLDEAIGQGRAAMDSFAIAARSETQAG